MTDDTLGMMATCDRCGGQNQRTGRKREELRPHAFGVGTNRIDHEELKCAACGRSIWHELEARTSGLPTNESPAT